MANCEWCGRPITTEEFEQNDGLCYKCKPKVEEKKTYNHYVTFGQDHTHNINGKTLDKDTVACYQAKDGKEGRDKAFEYFGDKFFTDYHDTQFKEESLKYFPKGIVIID